MSRLVYAINFKDGRQLADSLEALLNVEVRFDIPEKEEKPFVLYYMPDNSPEEVLKLRKQLQRYGSSNFVLASEKLEASLLAWRLNCLYFILMPLNTVELKKAIARHQEEQTAQKTEQNIQFRDEQGIHNVRVSDILFIKADGNYSHLHLKDDKRMVVSKQIQFIDQMLSDDASLVRIGRSFMINLSAIRKIEKGLIGFYESSNQLKLSAVYIKRVKKLFIEYMP